MTKTQVLIFAGVAVLFMGLLGCMEERHNKYLHLFPVKFEVQSLEELKQSNWYLPNNNIRMRKSYYNQPTITEDDDYYYINLSTRTL